MSELIWDKSNRKHAVRHGVSIKEIEEVFCRKPVIDAHEAGEGEEESQFRAYGTTAKGRYVTVAFSERDGFFRPIAAWPMEPEEFEEYADQIHIYPSDNETETQ